MVIDRCMPAALLTTSAILFSGCFAFTTRDEGQAVKQQVQHLNDRLTKIENDAEKNNQTLEEMIAKAQVQVKDMEETLSRATRVLARNSADFGAEMEEVKNEMMAFSGSVAEINHSLEEMQESLKKNDKRIVDFAYAAGLDMPVDEELVPSEANEHFAGIKSSFNSARFGEARSLGRLYIKRYVTSDRLDEVQLLIGKSYIAQKRYAKALGELRRFADLYPKSKHMAEVMYEMAVSFFRLGDCTDATILIDTVKSRHANSPFATKAEKLEQTISRQSSKCTS